MAEALLRPCQDPRSCRVTFTSSAVVPLTLPLALHATGRASETTALRLIDVPGFQPVGKALLRHAKALGVASLRLVLIPGSRQRGHVALQVAALDCSATAPLSPDRRPGYASQYTRRCCVPRRRL